MNSLFSKKLVIVLVIVVLASVVGVGLFMSKITSQKPIQQPELTLNLVPTNQTVQLNQSMEVVMSVDAGNFDVSFVDFTLAYDKDRLNLESFAPSANFNVPILTQLDNSGIFRVVLGNNSTNKLTGNVEVGTLHFKGISAGDGILNLSAKEVTVRTNPPSDIATKPTQTVLKVK